MENNLFNEVQQKVKELYISLETARKYAKSWAEKERDYKVEISKEILRLKAEGMPSTIIQLVAYGLPNIASLRFKRDGSEAFYKLSLEDINIRKLELRLLEAQLDREYRLGG